MKKMEYYISLDPNRDGNYEFEPVIGWVEKYIGKLEMFPDEDIDIEIGFRKVDDGDWRADEVSAGLSLGIRADSRKTLQAAITDDLLNRIACILNTTACVKLKEQKKKFVESLA